MATTIPVLPSTSYYAYVEWLERNDPVVRRLSDELRRAEELGQDIDAINERFNAAVEERLAGVVALCVACQDTANVVRGAELAMTNVFAGPLHNACIDARVRAVRNGNRCCCRPGQRRRSDLHEPHGQRGRAWVSCLRCLGVIEQVR